MTYFLKSIVFIILKAQVLAIEVHTKIGFLSKIDESHALI